MSDKVKLITIGVLAGAANGFFGSGGGLFVVPLLISWIKIDQRLAFATSMSVIFPLCIVSAIVYFFKGSIDFAFALPMLIGGFFGGIISGKIFLKIPIFYLRKTLGILLIYCGVKSVLGL